MFQSPSLLGHPFHVAVTIQTYSPESFNLNTPLAITEVINPNFITLTPQTDLVDEDNLETLRKAWEAQILMPHAVSTTHDNPDSETLVKRAFSKISSEMGDASLVALVQEARFPIPPDYTIALPQTGGLKRQKIIEGLVPFRGTLEMLKRMEENFDLPIATIRMTSQRIDVPTGPMN